MHSHINEPTNKAHVSRCKTCNCFTYITTQSLIPSLLNSYDTFFYHSPKNFSSFSIDDSNPTHINYLSKRRNGIRTIRYLTNTLHYSNTVLYKAILYMDKLFLQSEMSLFLIDNVSTICVLLSLQFNECCSTISLEDLFTLARLIPNYNELEIECLKCLQYDLSGYTTFDYLNWAFAQGVMFDSEYPYDINALYKQCIIFMNNFIEDDRALDFNPYVLAMTIIKFICEKNQAFHSEIVEYIYNINYREINFAQCYCILYYVTKSKKENKQSSYAYTKYTSSNIYSSTSTVASIDSFCQL